MADQASICPLFISRLTKDTRNWNNISPDGRSQNRPWLTACNKRKPIVKWEKEIRDRGIGLLYIMCTPSMMVTFRIFLPLFCFISVCCLNWVAVLFGCLVPVQFAWLTAHGMFLLFLFYRLLSELSICSRAGPAVNLPPRSTMPAPRLRDRFANLSILET